MRSQRRIFRALSLMRLLRDQRGAVMAIVGLAIIPLFAIIGLAIDTTRAYLTKSRLWSAVDAAALAAAGSMRPITATTTSRCTSTAISPTAS
jgi:Flp pilus assembly protein TadG